MKKISSTGLSAGGECPIQSVKEITATMHKKLQRLNISDAEEFLALWAIKSLRTKLCDYLGTPRDKLEKMIPHFERHVHPLKLQQLQYSNPRRYALGALRPSEKDIAKSLRLSPEKGIAASLPASVNFARFMPRIRDQGSRGTCVAFAFTAVHEFYEYRNSIDFSEQFIYYMAKQLDGIKNSCGTYLWAAAKALNQSGQCREAVWPYNPNSGCNNHGTMPKTAPSDANRYKMNCSQVNPRSVSDIKTKLANRCLVSFGIPVFNSWYQSQTVARTGKITMPLPNEGSIGGHAMCLIGYQDDKSYPGGGYFILRNSWNTGWGANCPYGAGNGTIPYQYISNYSWEAFAMPSGPYSPGGSNKNFSIGMKLI
jgi:C1A family cysteine protease